jgi:hypothetical protein
MKIIHVFDYGLTGRHECRLPVWPDYFAALVGAASKTLSEMIE